MALDKIDRFDINAFRIKEDLKAKLNALIDSVNALEDGHIDYITDDDFKWNWHKRLGQKINAVLNYAETESLKNAEVRQFGMKKFMSKVNDFMDEIENEDASDMVMSSSSSSSSSSSENYSESSSSSSSNE